MKSIYQSAVSTIKFRKIYFARCPCLFRYVSLPLHFRPLLDQLRLENRNNNFSLYSTIDYKNLLTRADIQEYLQFLNKEYDKYCDGETRKSEVLTYVDEMKNYEDHLKTLRTLSKTNDEELDKLVKKEEDQLKDKITHIQCKILSLTFPEDKNDKKGAIIEVTPGVGGDEAKLFAEEIFEMYLKYIHFKGWNTDYVDEVCTEGGGISKGEISVPNESVFSLLKYEAGIHRVQRIPKTEKAGRIQTSTCKVHVLPLVEDNEIELKQSDLKIETRLSSGPGGQNVQKTETSVRVIHLPTGLTAESQKERFQKQNILIAIKKLKNMLYEKELKKQELEESALKKKQVATILRSDKVRTYNFSQNRVTDHRINHTAHNVKLFMEGTGLLDEFVYLLDIAYQEESLLKNVSKILKEKNAEEIFNK